MRIKNQTRVPAFAAAAVIALTFALDSFAADKKSESPFTLNWSTEGVEVLEGDKKVFFYQRAPKSLDGKHTRANYLHPVYDLDGQVITEDFPKDHFHHRGIFWTWHYFTQNDEKLGDPWKCEDIVWDVVNVEEVDAGNTETLTLMADVVWKSQHRKDDRGILLPLLKETTFIRVHKAAENHRRIDFEIRLRALVENLKLGGSEDDKGYGGFSTRIKLPSDLQFVGRNGAVEPNRLAVEGGPWLDFSGSLNDTGKTTGLAILQHPTLPDFPQKWILRRKTSMQNPQWPGTDPVAIPTDKPLTLRHRIVLHRGNAKDAEIGKLQKEYEAEANSLAKLKLVRPAPEKLSGARAEIYKRIGLVNLPIHIYQPKFHVPGMNRPAVVFFFGGGWKGGNPGQFEQHCKYLASRGMVAMTAEYRVLSRHGVRAVECHEDARSAMIWVRKNAERLGIDPNRVASAGGSAGGHLAASLVSLNIADLEGTGPNARPNAMVLFNPALVLAQLPGRESPFSQEKMIGMPYRVGLPPQLLSPIHLIRRRQPPSIIFHGKADPIVKYATAEWYQDAARRMGNRCDLIGYEDEVHGFFNYGKGGNKMFATTLKETDKFLKSLGWLVGKEKVDEFLAQIPAKPNR